MSKITEPQEIIRSHFEQVLSALASDCARMTVRLLPSLHKPILVVSCSRTDYGAVLGKRKSMLNALKLLATGFGHRYEMEVELILDKPDYYEEIAARRQPDRDSWDQEVFEKLATLFCSELFPRCSVAVEACASSVNKITIALTEEILWGSIQEVEEALQTLFNCVGSVRGRRIVVELLIE